MRALSVLMAGALRKYRGIEGITVAKAMVAAAQKNAAGKHVYLYDDMVELSESVS